MVVKMFDIKEKIYELEKILDLEARSYRPMQSVIDMHFDGDEDRARLFFYALGVFQRGFIAKQELYELANMAGATRGLVNSLLARMGLQ
tara:strand:- start:1984 stop:2250 length:267 start_codon:yes stop_codon:yes gene_type:complete